MKKKILSLLFASALVLGACSGDDSDPVDEQGAEDEVEEAQEIEASEEESQDKEREYYEFNELVEDNENVRVKIISVERLYAEDSDEEAIGIAFEIENKTDRVLDVQSRNVSINDKMIDESLSVLTQDIAAGKSADVYYVIEDYESEITIPEIEGNLEMALVFLDWDDWDFDEEVPVRVEF